MMMIKWTLKYLTKEMIAYQENVEKCSHQFMPAMQQENGYSKP